MKPHLKNRNQSYFRKQRNRVLRRKVKIAKHKGWSFRHAGYFAKGKVHCSCPMCSQKTNRDGYSHSDKKKLIALNCRLKDYFNNN